MEKNNKVYKASGTLDEGLERTTPPTTITVVFHYAFPLFRPSFTHLSHSKKKVCNSIHKVRHKALLDFYETGCSECPIEMKNKIIWTLEYLKH